MKRIIRLTESDLARIVKRVINEQDNNPLAFATDPNHMDYAGFNKSSEPDEPFPNKITLKVKKSGQSEKTYDMKIGDNNNTDTYVIWTPPETVEDILPEDLITMSFEVPFEIESLREDKWEPNDETQVRYVDLKKSGGKTTVNLTVDYKGHTLRLEGATNQVNTKVPYTSPEDNKFEHKRVNPSDKKKYLQAIFEGDKRKIPIKISFKKPEVVQESYKRRYRRY